MATKQKLTVYLPEEVLLRTRMEAERQERSLSWIIHRAWEIAKDEISRLPSAEHHERKAHERVILGMDDFRGESQV